MKYLPIINTALLVVVLSIVALTAFDKPKMAYVDLGTVFNEFAMQQELSGQLEQLNNTRQVQLDSLEVNLQRMASLPEFNPEAPNTRFLQLRQDYLQRKEQYEQDSQRLVQEYDKQIWTQLNQYLNDFGQKANYSFVFGANGQGSVMFADAELNLTKEVISYINERYEGK